MQFCLGNGENRVDTAKKIWEKRDLLKTSEARIEKIKVINQIILAAKCITFS